MKFRFEEEESLPVVETVRAALYHRGKFLILQKSADSINPAALEFPGGKIDEMAGKISTKEEQEKALVAELQQETRVEVSKLLKEKVDEFEVYFEAKTKDNKKRQSRYRVYLFLVRIPDSEEIVVRVNETINERGESEDNHAGYYWVTPEELIDRATRLRKNEITEKVIRPLSKNSRHVKNLLKAVGYLKSP